MLLLEPLQGMPHTLLTADAIAQQGLRSSLGTTVVGGGSCMLRAAGRPPNALLWACFVGRDWVLHGGCAALDDCPCLSNAPVLRPVAATIACAPQTTALASHALLPSPATSHACATPSPASVTAGTATSLVAHHAPWPAPPRPPGAAPGPATTSDSACPWVSAAVQPELPVMQL